MLLLLLLPMLQLLLPPSHDKLSALLEANVQCFVRSFVVHPYGFMVHRPHVASSARSR